MFKQRTYTALFIICLLLALFSVFGVFSFLRRRAAEKETYSEKKEWYRFAIPWFLAVFFAFWGGHGMEMAGFWQWIYFFFIAIGVPFAAAYVLNKTAFEKKKDRIMLKTRLTALAIKFSDKETATE